MVGGGYLPLTGRRQADTAADVIGEFCDRRDRLLASEVVLVSYTREAYESPLGNHVRVTFDREIWGRDCRADKIPPPTVQEREVSGNQVVLEIKFTKEMPFWVGDLIRTFHLERISYPKYVTCVEALGLRESPQTVRF